MSGRTIKTKGESGKSQNGSHKERGGEGSVGNTPARGIQDHAPDESDGPIPRNYAGRFYTTDSRTSEIDRHVR